jgi:hypothetical protein
MGFRKWNKPIVAFLLASCCLQSAASSVTSESIIKAITDAKITAPGYKINAVVYPNTHEVIVSTYANSSSKDAVTDCKIDALLIARKVIETSAQTVRVKVRFYQANQATYQEVVITKPEITAFSSGAVQKDELLTSLEVVTMGGASQDGSPTIISPTTGSSIVNTAAATTHPAVITSHPLATASSALKPTDKFLVCRKQGLMFYYPKSWGSKDLNTEWGDFVELFNNRSAWMSIMFRLQDKDSPEQTASDENKYFWSSHQRTMVQQPKAAQIGYAKNILAQIYYLKDNSNTQEPDRYEKHVYFGYKHRIYSLSVRFCKADYESANADLNTILNTMIRE